jgi:hypothetical protein
MYVFSYQYVYIQRQIFEQSKGSTVLYTVEDKRDTQKRRGLSCSGVHTLKAH